MQIGDRVTVKGHEAIPDGTKAFVSKLEETYESDGKRISKYRSDVVQITIRCWLFFRKKEWVFKRYLKKSYPAYLQVVK